MHSDHPYYHKCLESQMVDKHEEGGNQNNLCKGFCGRICFCVLHCSFFVSCGHPHDTPVGTQGQGTIFLMLDEKSRGKGVELDKEEGLLEDQNRLSVDNG